MYGQSTNKLIALATAIALLVMVLPLGVACDSDGKSPPTAGFSAEPTSGTAPLQVQFTDRSRGDITDWAWDFDNDGVLDSTEQNPSYTYETPGRYTVSLEVTGPGGSDREIKAQYIEVAGAGPAPEADFSAEPTSGPVPLEVQFTDESTGDIASWSWDFGDGGTSTEQNPSHTYDSAGTYTVSLMVTNPSGSDTETKVDHIVVYVAPEADFSASDTSVAATQEVEFTDESTGATAWEWDFDNDGIVDSTEQNPCHAYDAPGEYTVTLTVAGPDGTDTETKVGYVKVAGRVTITIGHLTDIAGPAGSALKPITNSLIDQVKDFNEKEVIPGVEIKVVVYDTKYDPSRFTPGYNWARDRGATVISTEMGEVGIAVKAFAERDKLPVYCYTGMESIIDPPGWVFCANPIQEWQVRATLKYVGEQWEALEMGRPAKIGLVSWDSPTFYEYEAGMDYATDHPLIFDYVGGYATPMGGLTWSGEVEKLKDCDYVMIAAIGGLMPATFANEFRSKEEVHATFLGTDALAAYKSLMVDEVGWADIDGTITAHGWTWWTYDSPVVDYIKFILEKYRPDEVEETIASGIGGIGGGIQVYLFLEVLRAAIEAVGAENFDGQAFYDTAENFSTTWEGFKEISWTPTKRYASDWLNLWEWDKDVEDLVFIKWAEVIK